MRATLASGLWLLAIPALAAEARPPADRQPYGCWSLADPTERLTCFDLALGPPGPSGSCGDAGPASAGAAPARCAAEAARANASEPPKP